jgi:hypothetical protein
MQARNAEEENRGNTCTRISYIKHVLEEFSPFLSQSSTKPKPITFLLLFKKTLPRKKTVSDLE